MNDGRDWDTPHILRDSSPRHRIRSRDLWLMTQPNNRHNFAAALERFWAFLLGLRP